MKKTILYIGMLLVLCSVAFASVYTNFAQGLCKGATTCHIYDDGTGAQGIDGTSVTDGDNPNTHGWGGLGTGQYDNEWIVETSTDAKAYNFTFLTTTNDMVYAFTFNHTEGTCNAGGTRFNMWFGAAVIVDGMECGDNSASAFTWLRDASAREDIIGASTGIHAVKVFYNDSISKVVVVFNEVNFITQDGNSPFLAGNKMFIDARNGNFRVRNITAWNYTNTSLGISGSGLWEVAAPNNAPDTPVITHPSAADLNTTPIDILFTSHDDDDDPMTYEIYINSTLNMSGVTGNITIWNASSGYYNITMTANDGTNTSANSTTVLFEIDNTPPQFNTPTAGLAGGNLRIGDVVDLQVTVIEPNPNLSDGFWNNSGTFVNISLSGYSDGDLLTRSPSISLPRGNTICFGFWADDDLGNENISTTECFVVRNSLPSTTINITSTNELNNTYANLTAINSSITDADGEDTKMCWDWKVNGTSDAKLNIPMENGSAFDISDYSNHGVVTGATYNSTGGYDGFGAYEFDGVGDYIATTGNNMSALYGNKSISGFAWIKTKSNTGQEGIISKDLNTNRDWFFYHGGNDIGIRLYNSAGTSIGNLDTSSNSLTTDNWHFVGFTYNKENQNLTLYIDATQEISAIKATMDSFKITVNPLLIGTTYSKADTYTMNGTIDDVRIYNRSLTPQEITNLYQNKTNIFDSTATNLNNTYTVNGYPTDGTDFGVNITSEGLKIINNQPVIDEFLYFKPDDGNRSDLNFTVRFKVEDADDDTVECTLYVNDTINSTPLTVVLNNLNYINSNITEDGVYSWYINCTDSFDYTTTTPRTFTLDTTAPSFNTPAINDTGIRMDGDLNLTVTIVDLSANYTRFFWNASGTYANDSAVTYTTGVEIVTIKSINYPKDSYICFGYWANDSLGHTNVSALSCFIVQNTPPTAPVVTSPLSDEVNNTLDFNFTSTDVDNDSIEFYIFIDDVLVNITSINKSNYPLADGIYEINVSAYDGLNFSANTSINNFTLDTTLPAITLNDDNGFLTDNSTKLNILNELLQLNITFFDKNLHEALVNITNSSGDVIFLYLNTSIGETTANVTNLLNFSNQSLQNITIWLEATDDHTTEDIDDYEVIKGLNYLRYLTAEGSDIKIETRDFLLSAKTEKKKDRYEWDFNFLLKKDEYEFILTSDKPITYLKHSKYNAHFITGYNWVDFEIEGYEKTRYKVTRISDYEYRITIKAKDKNLKFKSLGGLNRVYASYQVELTSIVDVWVYNDYTGYGVNATATITLQTNNTVDNRSPATLKNLSGGVYTLKINATGYVNLTETITITQNYHNVSYNMTPTNSLKLTFYDETDNIKIRGEVLDVVLKTSSTSTAYEVNTTTDNPYMLLNIENNTYDIEVSSDNYQTREFSDREITDSASTVIDVYLINNTLGSEITFDVRDEALNPLENVLIIFRRVINTSIIVAEETTDYNGQTKLYLDSNYEYDINFSKDGYNTKLIQLEPDPNDDPYVIQLTKEGVYNMSTHAGITYQFTPSNEILQNDTVYDFKFELNSSLWTITGCTLVLKNGSLTLDTQIGTFDADSCFSVISYNTSNMTNITAEATYVLDDIYTFVKSQTSLIEYTYVGEFSLKNFLDDLTNFNKAGFDDFGRALIAMLLIFIIIAVLAIKGNITQTEDQVIIIVLLVWAFSYIGWFYFGALPAGFGEGIKKYIIAVLVTLGGGIFVLDRYTR